MKMTKDEAATIALYLKRITWNDYQRNAVNEEEAYKMKDALYLLQKALRDQGFDSI